MNKTNIKRLLHTVLTFMIMILVQRSILLLFQTADIPFFSDNVISLTAFLASAGTAVLTFKCKTYTVDSETETPPLVKTAVGMSAAHTTAACAVMVAVMYTVSLLMNGGSTHAEFSAVSVISLILIHPVLEELIFRKMFYGELRLLSRVFACIAQTLMFAILHSTVDGMIYALCSGLVLAVLYERTGRISACIIAHIFINLRSLLSLTVLLDMPSVIHILDFALVIAGIACFAAAALVPTHFSKKEDSSDA